MRLVSVERGLDPRDFALVVFGGAGPLHANAIAHELRIPEVIIPLSPGVSSALGLLLADIKHDFVRTYIKDLSLVDLDFVNRAFAEFEREGRALLEREGIGAENQRFLRTLDMRLKGQSFELKVALDPGTISVSQLQSAAAAFHELHALTYGHGFPGEPVEIVNLRLTAQGVIPKPRMRRVKEASDRAASAEHARKGDRSVCFQAADGFVSTPIYDRHALQAGARVAGPAILEQFDSTVRDSTRLRRDRRCLRLGSPRAREKLVAPGSRANPGDPSCDNGKVGHRFAQSLSGNSDLILLEGNRT